MTRVAIHQPNFMPWLGVFHKAALADRFVILDHVQAPGGPSWLNRNRILVDGKTRWLTMPVQRSGHGLPAVNEVRIQWQNRLVDKQLRTLTEEYGRHPHFEEIGTLIGELYASRPELLAALNEAFFRRVLDGLGLSVELVRSSELCAAEPRLRRLRGSALVLATCQAAGGREYVCGDGSLGYIDPPAFEAEGIGFTFQRFAHPEYPQRGVRSFVSHLSVLDALFNVGFSRTRELVWPQAASAASAAQTAMT